MAGTVDKTLAATGAQADGTSVSPTLVPGFSATGFNIGAGNSFTFQSSVATAFGQSYGYRAVQAGANTVTAYMDLAAAETGVFAWRDYFRFQNTPISTVIRRLFPDATHADNLGSLTHTSTNRLQFLEDSSGGGTPLNVTSTGTVMSAATAYCGLGKIDLAANTFGYILYPLGNPTQVFSISGTLAADAAAATGIQSLRLPIGTASSGIGNYDLGADTAVGHGDYLPRTDISNTAPIANAGADQTNIEPRTTVTISGTGSTDSDVGDTLTYAWTQIAGTAVTLSSSTAASPTFTAPLTLAGDTLVFSLTVTDNHGTPCVTPDTVSITVLPADAAVWTGTAWSPRQIMTWNGSAWV